MYLHDQTTAITIEHPAKDHCAASQLKNTTGVDISPYCPEQAAPHIERICRSFINAINSRDLYSFSPVWANNCSSAFAADHDCPVRKKKLIMDLDEWLLTKRDMIATDNPNYRIEVPEMNTTIYQKEGTADVYMVIRSHGLIGNAVAQDIGMFEFRYWHGKWTCTKYKGLRGMNDGTHSAYGSVEGGGEL